MYPAEEPQDVAKVSAPAAGLQPGIGQGAQQQVTLRPAANSNLQRESFQHGAVPLCVHLLLSSSLNHPLIWTWALVVS